MRFNSTSVALYLRGFAVAALGRQAHTMGVKISVVVPAYNEEKLIVASLRSMKASMAVMEEAGWITELIVCNNNSTDRTGELATTEGAKVVFEAVNQIGSARNCGASAA